MSCYYYFWNMFGLLFRFEYIILINDNRVEVFQKKNLPIEFDLFTIQRFSRLKPSIVVQSTQLLLSVVYGIV